MQGLARDSVAKPRKKGMEAHAYRGAERVGPRRERKGSSAWGGGCCLPGPGHHQCTAPQSPRETPPRTAIAHLLLSSQEGRNGMMDTYGTPAVYQEENQASAGRELRIPKEQRTRPLPK